MPLRAYLVTKRGNLKHWTTPFLKVDAQGWMTLGRFGKYQADMSSYACEEYKPLFWPLDFRTKERWAVLFTEGNSEAVPWTGAAPSPNQTAYLIEEAMDRTWIQQALRRPGWDWQTIGFFACLILNFILGGAVVSLALRA